MTTPFLNPISINHKGNVIYFVSQASDDSSGDKLFYNVLSKQTENEDTNENWDGYTQLNFPDEVSLAGMNMLRVKRKVKNAGFFQVVTDQQFIYVIRAEKKSLYINRYVMVEIPNEKVNATTRIDLQPNWEVRFKDSGKPDTPAGEKDTQSFINQDGKQFIEPIFEMPFGLETNELDLTKGFFTTNLLPTNEPDILRWQFLIVDVPGNKLLSYNIARTAAGWFQFSNNQFDVVQKFIKPDRSLDFVFSEKPVKLIGPPSSSLYTKQEPVETSDSTVLKLQQVYRMLTVFQVQDEELNNFTASLDSAVSRFGTLSYPELPNGDPKNTIPLGQVQNAPFSLEFNGSGWAKLTGDPIVLGNSFTQQVWVYPTSKDTKEKVILGTVDPAITPENRPPSIWVVDKYKIGVGFGNGTTFLQMKTVKNAFNTNSWNNIIVSYKEEKYTVLINGSEAEMTGDDFTGALPTATPVNCIGGNTYGQFSGIINEVRIWSEANQTDALKYMYERIPGAIAKEMANLEAYFPMNEGVGTEIKNLSSNTTRSGTLSGAIWVSDASPLKTTFSPTSYTDKKGLTCYAGAIVPADEGRFKKFGAIKPESRPYLLSSSDGYLHLYYQGTNDEFLVAQYDTSNSRAHFGVGWEAISSDVKNTQSGDLIFSSRQTGTTFNHSKIDFKLNAETQLFTIELDDNQGSKETWNGIPGEMNYIVEVLSGNSINETTDPRLSIGERVFFDYSGERNQHFETVGEPLQKGLLQLVSRNVDAFVFDSIEVVAGAAPSTCDVTLAINFESDSSSGTFSKKMKNVANEVEEFVKTINGSSSVYNYQNPDNTEENGVQFFNIPAGKQSILTILNDPKISGMLITIEDSEKSTPKVPSCDATFTLTFKNSDELSATWENIPRISEDFIKGILDAKTPKQKKVAPYLNFYEKTGTVEIQNGSIEKPASLYALTSFLDIFRINAKGTVTPFKATCSKLQSVISEGETANLKMGSMLFGVFPNGAPDNGFPAFVQNTQSGILLQPGRDGGWVADSPRFCVAIDSPRSYVKIPVNKVLNKPLEIPGSLSIESWVNINPIIGSRKLSDLSYPRILHANLPGEETDAKYMLGTSYSKALKFLQEQTAGPAAIEVKNSKATEENQKIFGDDQYTFSFYVKPVIATAIDAGGILFSIVPEDTNYPTQRMVVKQDGSLYYELLETGAVTLQKKFSNTLPDKTWSSIAITRSGNEITLYYNGKKDQSFDFPVNAIPFPITSTLILGNNSTIAFQMEMNEVAVWNRTMQPLAIADRYNMSIPADDEGLLLLYRLSDDTNEAVILNEAAITGAIYNSKVTGFHIWSFPGVFCPAYFAVRNKAVVTTQALLSTSAWNHVVGMYDEHYGIQLTNKAYGDCGNEGSLNVDSGLTIEAWVMQTAAVKGGNQVIFSKYGDALSEQSYEFGINGNSKPYVTVKISGRTTGKESKDAAPESDLYFTITGSAVLSLHTSYYLAATVTITSEALKINENKSVNEFTLTGQLYVNGSASGGEFTSEKMYGDISINQTDANANMGRTKPDGLPQNQQYYSGKISDLRLWKSALSAKDIKANYQMVNPVLSGDSLVSSWYFSEQQGRTAFDNTSENNAVLSNRDLWFLFLENSKLSILINGRPTTVKPIDVEVLDGYSEPQITLGNMKNELGGYTNLLDGSIDDVRVWTEVRTLAQINDNKERALTGREKNLAGYWQCQGGSGKFVFDNTGNGNDGEFSRLNNDGGFPSWQNSDAPISNEAGIVTNALGGKPTHFSKLIQAGVTVVEYADSQFNYKKELFSIYKRCYIYIDTNGVVQRETSFKIGDLNQIFLGQVQSKPSLIGFIEGAPPIPSENLTLPFYNSPTAYSRYSGISSVSLTEADDTTVAFSANRKDGSHLSFGIGGGFAMADEREVPLLTWKLSKVDFKIGIANTIDWSTSQTNQSGSSYGLSALATNKMANSGNWERKGSDWQHATEERRFIPANVGYALVVSRTADMFALYLESTGAMVGFTVIPNLDIPPDKNIIHFPINPKYTKNGTLDGKVGLITDTDYPNADVKRGSYFKPTEAYTIKRKIEKKEMELLSYYQQFNAIDRGQSSQNDVSGIEENNPIYNFDEGRPRADLVNNYVWTASGGLYAEKESAMSMRQESHSGSYSFKWALGLKSEGKFMFGFGSVLGAYYNLSLMGGTDFTVTVQKSKTASNKFSLDVAASPEGFLKAALKDKDSLYSQEDVPGKVDAYRFMSFYLSPDTQNFDDFFDKVKGIVDPAWLDLSDDPQAAALREARANPNPSWRILHRVTYVSRIPPEFNPFPLDTNAPPENKPANMTANLMMIQLVADRLKDVDPIDNTAIGLAVRKVISEDLATIIPWWADFLKATLVDNSDEQKTLTAFIFDSIEYMTLYYATLDQPNS